MNAHEHQERPHHKVVQDAHLHGTTEEVHAHGEEAPVGRHAPQAESGVAGEEDQERNQQVHDLLRHAELSRDGVVTTQEQVVADPGPQLVLVIALGQPRLVVHDQLARTGRRGALDEEREHHAHHAVEQQHDAKEDVQATSQAHHTAKERVVDVEAR